ncbi:DUF6049 family protein [Nocardiopsis lucentensis]|uniref:DUF6049 family protein n=1 Tax=Nocardiopsis lucentensis TaxID=53441 RepID=UPI0003631477|nr:DUF6049 family protein [Nocardiopsis lucentensis]
MAMTAGLLPTPAALSPALAEPENDESVEPLVIERVTPDAVDSDSTLRVSGVVTNTTAGGVEDVTVRIRYSRHPFSGRDELDEFASGAGWQPNAPGPDEDVADTLAPDDSEEFSLSVPVEDLKLSSYGVYPLVIEALDGDGERLGAQYTFLPFTGEDDDVPSVDIAWVWPLMAEPQRADDDTFLGGALSESVGEDGRLSRLLETGAQTDLAFEAGDEDLVELLGLDEEPTEPTPEPERTDGATAEPSDAEPTGDEPSDDASEETADGGGEADAETSGGDGAEDGDPAGAEGVPVTWAVDPGTLDDIVRLARDSHDVLGDPIAVSDGSDPAREEHQADLAAQVWLREARAVLAEDTVVATPYASSDLASLLRNGMTADAAASVEIGRDAVLRALGLTADESFALPPNGLMDDAVYEFLAAEGAHRFLVDEAAKPPASWLSTTPTAQAALRPVEGGPEEEPFALVADQGLADVLAMPSRGPGETELALQRFAAETAMIAGENAGGERVVVAYPGPDWNPSDELASGVLEASDSLPWLTPERLADVELADPDDRETTRQPLTYPNNAYSDELSSTYLGQITDVSREVRLFNSILVDDGDPFRPAILRMESVHWRDRETMAGATRTLVSESVQSHLGDVRIIPGEPVTLASSTGITGILVANDLEDEAIHVRLSVYSENSERLSIGEYSDEFEIAPGAKTTVYIPLSARINGRTELHASLQNGAGEPISAQATVIPVNATGLGTQALLISGIGLLILIAALAPRAVRKWVRRQAARGAKDQGKDARGGDGNPDDGEEPTGREDDAEEGGASADETSPGSTGHTGTDEDGNGATK